MMHEDSSIWSAKICFCSLLRLLGLLSSSSSTLVVLVMSSTSGGNSSLGLCFFGWRCTLAYEIGGNILLSAVGPAPGDIPVMGITLFHLFSTFTYPSLSTLSIVMCWGWIVVFVFHPAGLSKLIGSLWVVAGIRFSCDWFIFSVSALMTMSLVLSLSSSFFYPILHFCNVFREHLYHVSSGFLHFFALVVFVCVCCLV